MPTDQPPRPRVHVWAPVAFAHLRAHRCGVFLDDDSDELCPEPPLHLAEWQALLPRGRGPLTALCGGHADQARTWPTVVSVQLLRDRVG